MSEKPFGSVDESQHRERAAQRAREEAKDKGRTEHEEERGRVEEERESGFEIDEHTQEEKEEPAGVQEATNSDNMSPMLVTEEERALLLRLRLSKISPAQLLTSTAEPQSTVGSVSIPQSLPLNSVTDMSSFEFDPSAAVARLSSCDTVSTLPIVDDTGRALSSATHHQASVQSSHPHSSQPAEGKVASELPPVVTASQLSSSRSVSTIGIESQGGSATNTRELSRPLDPVAQRIVSSSPSAELKAQGTHPKPSIEGKMAPLELSSVSTISQSGSGSVAHEAKRPQDFLLKLLVFGDHGVGKSSIISRYTQGSIDVMAVRKFAMYGGFGCKTLKVDGAQVKMQLWDSATEVSQSGTPIWESLYRGAHAILLVYNVTCLQSFAGVRTWIRNLSTHHTCKDLPIILVGNHADPICEYRAVEHKRGQILSEGYEMDFMEVSAKDNINIDSLFEGLAQVFVQLGGSFKASEEID